MSEDLERDLRKEIDKLKMREEDIRILRQNKEAELRKIILLRTRLTNK